MVNIFNLWVKGTIEERVLDVLENRINVFQETVGGLDPILGDTENDIQRVMRMSADARESALLALGERLESDVRRARDAEKQLGDFIMDTKSFGRESPSASQGRHRRLTMTILIALWVNFSPMCERTSGEVATGIN